MKKSAFSIVLFVMCIALSGCADLLQNVGYIIRNQNQSSVADNFQENHASVGNNNTDTPEEYAEAALRMLLEDQSIARSLEMHYGPLYYMLEVQYTDLLGDLNSYGDYAFISCTHIKTSTVTSGDFIDGINDILSEIGLDTSFRSFTKCDFTVTCFAHGKNWSTTYSVYLAKYKGDYTVIGIFEE